MLVLCLAFRHQKVLLYYLNVYQIESARSTSCQSCDLACQTTRPPPVQQVVKQIFGGQASDPTPHPRVVKQAWLWGIPPLGRWGLIVCMFV